MAVKKDFSTLLNFKEQLKKAASPEQSQIFLEDCVREIAARFLSEVIKRTPTGPGTFEVIRDKKGNAKKHKWGKDKGKLRLRRLTNGGTLRRAWTVGKVTHAGKNYQVEITNPIQYASYVEYGHRQTPGKFIPVLGKRLKKSWVEGKFMMKLSEDDLRKAAPKILSKKLNRYLQEVLNAK